MSGDYTNNTQGLRCYTATNYKDKYIKYIKETMHIKCIRNSLVENNSICT